MQLAGNMEIGFRFFDIGSDKQFFSSAALEPNPALGCRSIRFLMKNPSIFSTQVRAVLRASLYGKVKFLLPLVSDLIELREAKAFILREKEEMAKEGIPVPKELLIGCMVEVPAFVIMCDQLIKECDFVSIGTNDLVQYSLVVDRMNPETCNRYGPTHPSILRMIHTVVKEGTKNGKMVSICGRIASDPEHIELLIGLGLRIFSCSLRDIPLVKRAIEKVDVKEAEKLAKKALCFD